MLGSFVKERELKLDASSAVSEGLPADTSIAIKYTTSGDFGAVLICADTVTIERTDYRDPFGVWLKENAAKLLSDYPVLKSRGVYVVTTTYSCSDVYINAWNNPQDEITVGFRVNASGIGSTAPPLAWMPGNSQHSWTHFVSGVRSPTSAGKLQILKYFSAREMSGMWSSLAALRLNIERSFWEQWFASPSKYLNRAKEI
jgi:hypothetical protein